MPDLNCCNISITLIDPDGPRQSSMSEIAWFLQLFPYGTILCGKTQRGLCCCAAVECGQEPLN